MGKLSTHEFAIGGPSFDLPWPPARNPWNRDYFCGGSSSGSGAATAAGFLPAAIGTDTGGSVRIPAAVCGIVGFKPTAARVPRDGCLPLSTSFDSIGPLAHSVACCIAIDRVLAWEDIDAPLPEPTPAPAVACVTGSF
jgi:aspartyl-tRNA(Asn)/glutamyl-tRNA(Gln) amidotransferase subunit A